MSAPAGYFVAPDANGEVWIWRERVLTPIAVVPYSAFADALPLWDYLVSDLPYGMAL